MDRVKDAVCVVTGAASGIGESIARRLAAEGGLVYGLDRAAAGGAGPGGTGSLEMLEADVTRLESLERAAAHVLAAHGRVDVLVTAAGIWRPATVTSEDAVAVWDAVVEVNLRGAFLTSHVFVPPMIAQGRGSVIHIGSISGLIGNKGSSAYSASKGGVISLARSMALDYGPNGVRVNCVCPGIVRTPMLAATETGLSPDEVAAADRARAANIPAGRVGLPADIAAAVLYLASAESVWTTGSCLVVDGGYLAGR